MGTQKGKHKQKLKNKFKANDLKMKELMLYLAQRSEDDPNFGATKLNKLMFFADFKNYVETGKSITGQTYQKLEHGPAPKRLIPLREELISSKDAALKNVNAGSYTQERLIALREATVSEFSGDEIATVERVLKNLEKYNGTQSSDLSHDYICWKAFRKGDIIPYETAFVLDRQPTEEESAYALKLEASCGT